MTLTTRKVADMDGRRRVHLSDGANGWGDQLVACDRNVCLSRPGDGDTPSVSEVTCENCLEAVNVR